MERKTKIVAIGLMVPAIGAMAQMPVDGIHYAAGSYGIKGGSAPGPGVYLQDQNYFYTGSADIALGYDTFVYAQVPQLTWITGWTFLDASLGMAVEVPIEYREASLVTSAVTPGGQALRTRTSDHRFGLGDIGVTPLMLGWHWQHFDTTLSYSLWVPSGDFTAGRLANLGDDAWVNMVSLGGVWYPDEEKAWAVSLLHHCEINSSQVGTSTGVSPGGGYPFNTLEKIPCTVYTLEWGVSKTLWENSDVGIFGYYQKQFTDNTTAMMNFPDSEVAGIGPDVSVRIPSWDLTASVRYAYEFTAYHRPKGHTVNFEITKRF